MPSQANDKGQEKDKGGKHTIELNVVVGVGGTSYEITANEKAALNSIIPEALKVSGNVNQNPADWELKDKAGNVYDATKSPGELGLKSGDTIYLSRKAGAAG